MDRHSDKIPTNFKSASPSHRNEEASTARPDQFQAYLETSCRSDGANSCDLTVELDQREIDTISHLVPGGSSNVRSIHPLTPLQEGILFHRLLNEKSDSYVLSLLFETRTRTDVDRLVDALQSVVARHDILRSAVLWHDLRKPVQVVYHRAPLPIRELQLDPSRGAVDQMAQRMRPGSAPLDVRHAPIAQLLIAIEPEKLNCYALLQVHHLICDHRSLNIIVSEALAFLEGRAQLLATPVGYGSYVAQALRNARPEVAQAFFHDKLAKIEEPTAPFGITDIHGDDRRVLEVRRIAAAPWVKELRAKARHAEVRLARLFHAAWALVVAHTTGRDVVVFGTVILTARYRQADTASMLGMSVNTLPLRLDLRGLTAKQFLRQTDRELIELLQHADTPLTLAQACSGILGTAPLFTSLFNYRRGPSLVNPSVCSKDGDIRIIARGEAWSNYPLAITVDDTGEEMVFIAQTDHRVNPDRVISYMETAVSSLLDAMARAPETPALELPILPETERRELILGFRGAQSDYPRDRRLPQLFEAQAEQRPDATALVSGSQQLSYRQLNQSANYIAHVLRTRGIRANDRVAVYACRSPELIIGLLGILKAGGAYVPLDVEYPIERVAYMLQDSDPVAILTFNHLKSRLPPCTADVIALDRPTQGIEREIPAKPLEGEWRLSPRDLAYVIYTSGTTGKPKGVMVEHHSLENLVHWHCTTFEVTERSRNSCVASPGFDAATWEIWPPLAVGATLVLSPFESSGDTDRFLDWWSNEALDVSFLPTPLGELAFSRNLLNCQLRTLLVGGDRLRVHPKSKRFTLVNNYGPTETTVVATSGPIRGDDPALHIGFPISNAQIYILDYHRRLIPRGAAGEIWIGGVGVARGYLNQPELTAERFVPASFDANAGGRMYKTGDLGRWREDGTLEYLGRNDQQVKIRGFRVELAEIEAQLCRMPPVAEAVVIAHETPAKQKTLVAYVVKRPHSEIDITNLRECLKSGLPEYMVPGTFVMLEHMPRTPNGKLNRGLLAVPAFSELESQGYEPPQCQSEEILAAIWQSVLGLNRVGRHDNFFELGGHSLSVMNLVEHLRRVGWSTNVRSVYEHKTLEVLARTLTAGSTAAPTAPENRIPAGCTNITPEMLSLVSLTADHLSRIAQTVPGGFANIQDIYPLTPVQDGMLFHHLINARGSDAYYRVLLLSISSREEFEAFRTAMRCVIDRHDILRTAILWEGMPQPIQVVYRQVTLPIEELVAGPTGEALEQLRQSSFSEQQRLDLRRAPLMRLQIVADCPDHRMYAAVQTHHLVVDNESLLIMLSEVAAHMNGRSQELPKVGAYREHVAQALAYTSTSAAETFFRSTLAHIDEATAPFGLMDIQGDGRRIVKAHEEFDTALAQRLRRLARRIATTPATLFHTAWALVVSRTSGRDDVVFGTVLLGRSVASADVQRSIGVFINTLPLRIRLSGMTITELVDGVQREITALLIHEQASLAVAQRCSSISAATSLFSAVLNYVRRPWNPNSVLPHNRGVELLGYEGGTNYPVVLSVYDHDQGFSLEMETDESLDPHRMLTYMSTAIRSLVEALESAPHTPPLSLSILPDTEWQQVVKVFNKTVAVYRLEQYIHELFENQVTNAPNSIAVIHESHSVTYAELNSKANRLARYLKTLGVGPDTLVGICLERGIEFVVAILGVMKAGGAYVPLDTAYPTDRLQYMLRDSAPRVLLTQERLVNVLVPKGTVVKAFDRVLNETSFLDDENLDPTSIRLTPRNLAYVIYTSGSTGVPKGVLVEHRNLLASNLARTQFYGPYGHFLLISSFAFDSSVAGIFGTLTTGGKLTIAAAQTVQDSLALINIIRYGAVTDLLCVPSLYQNILSLTPSDDAIRSIERVVVAGEACPPSVVALSVQTAAHVQLYNEYGPTEATVWSTVFKCPDVSSERTVPIGCPISNIRVYILNRFREPVPVGVSGEIYIAGAGVARGYLRRPDFTAERFLADPFAEGGSGRMYKTGDIALWRSDGAIEYLGRNDTQVKIRGFRIELGEIEVTLSRHTGVKDAAVLAGDNGLGEKQLVAYVTASPQKDSQPAITVDLLRSYLERELPLYMVPRVFVIMERFPLTPNGKLDRALLPVPTLTEHFTRSYVPPQGEFERTVAEIWQEVLRLERVGRFDNFFELGGHSLLATRIISRLGARLQIELPIKIMFDAPTVAQLADRLVIEGRVRSSDDALWMTSFARDLKERNKAMSDEQVLRQILELENQLDRDPPAMA